MYFKVQLSLGLFLRVYLPGEQATADPFHTHPSPLPADVLSLPTGVLEQLRSMLEDSEEMPPGLQPV